MRIFTGNYGWTDCVQFVDDTGAVIDVSAATTKQLIYIPPGGAPVVKPAAFTTNGTDGKIQYTIDPALFTTAGKWTLYGHVTDGATLDKCTAPAEFYVEIAGGAD